MTDNKFVRLIGYIIVLFAIPFFLMVYCLRCERLRLSAQKKVVDKIIEQQRWKKYMDSLPTYDIDASDDKGPGCPAQLPERY